MNPPEQETLERLLKAITRFEEALALPMSEGVNLDGSIQRFEFTYELTWKCVKRALAVKGIDARSPRDAIKECYSLGWINHEEVWVNMLKDRNRTSHTYLEDIALEVYKRLPDYATQIRVLTTKLAEVL
jgi:nucleotidyltransferase substrate binding protein (TIGR01987 family)